MKEYVIKHQGYYIQEGVTCPHRVLGIEHATSFGTLESLTSYVNKDMALNVAHVQVECYEVVKTELINFQGQWLDSSLVSLCAECGINHLVEDMQDGVVDKETGVELFCNDCYETVDLIVQHRPLDELFNNPLNQLDKFIKVSHNE